MVKFPEKTALNVAKKSHQFEPFDEYHAEADDDDAVAW